MNSNRRLKLFAASLAVAALVLFLPRLLLHPAVAPFVLGVVARDFAGKVQVQSCSLGWWQGLRCDNLRYDEPLSGLHLRSPLLLSDKGLLALLLAPAYLGEMTLDQPTIALRASAAGKEQPAPPKPPVAVDGTTAMPWWDRLTLRLKVNGGQVLATGQHGERKIAHDLRLDASLAVGTINYVLDFRAGPEGRVKSQGFVNLPPAGQPLPESLISQSEVDIHQLEIADFLELAAARGKFPRGQGLLNATCRLNVAGIRDAELRGEASLREMALFGGVLGQDRPFLTDLRFTFTGSHHRDEGWRLSALELRSDPLQFQASGHLDQKDVQLTATGSLDLAAMAAQLPHLLSVHQKTTIENGRVDFSLQAAGRPDQLTVKADCGTERLEAVHAGQHIAWDSPLRLNLEAESNQGKILVRTAQARAPFFEAGGSGTLDAFTVQAQADLDRMFAELGKIFALEVRPRGQAAFAASSRLGEDGRYRLESRLDIGGFGFLREQAVLFPEHDLSLRAEIEGPPTWFRDGRMHALRLEATGWPGTFSLQADNIQPEARTIELAEASGPPANCFVKGTADLGRMGAVARGLGGRPLPLGLEGQLSLDASGTWNGQRIVLDRLDGHVAQLLVATEAGPLVREPRVGLGFEGGPLSRGGVALGQLMVADNWQDLNDQERAFLLLDFAAHQLDLRHLRFTSAANVVDFGYSMDNWHDKRSGVSLEVHGDHDASLLAGLAKAGGWIGQGMGVKGRARTSWTRQASDDVVEGDLTVTMAPFALFDGTRNVFTDPRLTLKMRTLGARDGKEEVRIPAFSLHAAPFGLEGTGLIRTQPTARVELQGRLTPHFPALLPLLQPMIGREIVLSGNEPGSFLLSLPLRLPLDLEQLTLDTHLPLARLGFHRIDLRDNALSLECNRGRLRAQLSGPLNGGKVTLRPEWQWKDRRATMTLPPASQVLLGVSLKRPLVEGLLAPMHPLFGALAQVEGTIDLRMEHFFWPVNTAGRQRPTFTVVLGLEKTRLKAKGALRDALLAAGLDRSRLRFQDRELVCDGKNGSVSCAPIRLLAGDSELVVSGGAEANGALSIRLRMPLTEHTARNVGGVVVEEATIETEISGTVSRPVFDRQAFLAAAATRLATEPTPPSNERQTEEPSAP